MAKARKTSPLKIASKKNWYQAAKFLRKSRPGKKK